MGLALVDGKSNDTFNKRTKELLELSKIVVADAYFSKKSFSDGLDKLGFSLVSRFRDGVKLKYLYTGPKLKKEALLESSPAGLKLTNLTWPCSRNSICLTEARLLWCFGQTCGLWRLKGK